MAEQTPPDFRRILVPLDGSTLAEQALPYARSIGGPDAEIDLLAVVPPAEATDDLRGLDLLVLAAIPQSRAQNVLQAHGGAPVEEIQARSEAAAREHLFRAARTWLGDRPNVRFRVVAGDPAEEIVRAAKASDADLIVLASHGRGAVGRTLFGSVADRVVRASPVPVMIVRPRDAAAEIAPIFLDRFVMPLDGSALATRAVPVAAGLAQRLRLPMLLLRVLDPAQIPRPVASPDGHLSFIEESEEEARRALEATAVPLRATGLSVKTEVIVGSPFAGVAATARPGDVIVLSSHGRGGVRRWLFGSTTEQLVRAGPVPVIVVPAGSRQMTTASRQAVALAT